MNKYTLLCAILFCGVAVVSIFERIWNVEISEISVFSVCGIHSEMNWLLTTATMTATVERTQEEKKKATRTAHNAAYDTQREKPLCAQYK